MDIGNIYTNGPSPGEELTSDEQYVLDQVYSVIGSEHVIRKKMECASQWLLNKAVEKELSSNWSDVYESVREDSVP